MTIGAKGTFAVAAILMAMASGAQAAGERNDPGGPVLKDAIVLDHNCSEVKDRFPAGDPNITTQCDPNDQ